MTRTAFAALALSLAAPAFAGRKKKNKDKDDSDAGSESSASNLDIPSDGTSKKFADLLLKTTIANFLPTDGDGAKFVYSTLNFLGDNTWKAEGYVEIMDERMECTESGTWTMDAAESDRTATLSWSLAKTDCAGRESGKEARAVLTINKDGSVDAAFR